MPNMARKPEKKSDIWDFKVIFETFFWVVSEAQIDFQQKKTWYQKKNRDITRYILDFFLLKTPLVDGLQN